MFCLEFFGWRPEDISVVNFSIPLHPYNTKAVQFLLNEHPTSGCLFVLTTRRAHDGGVTYLLGFSADLRQLYDAQLAMADEQRCFYALISSSRDNERVPLYFDLEWYTNDIDPLAQQRLDFLREVLT